MIILKIKSGQRVKMIKYEGTNKGGLNYYKVLSFGKVDYNGTGRKINEFDIEIK